MNPLEPDARLGAMPRTGSGHHPDSLSVLAGAVAGEIVGSPAEAPAVHGQ